METTGYAINLKELSRREMEIEVPKNADEVSLKSASPMLYKKLKVIYKDANKYNQKDTQE